MDQNNSNAGRGSFGTNRDTDRTAAGPANTPSFAAGGPSDIDKKPMTETERALEDARDQVAKTAAPIVAEKVQEAVTETTERLQGSVGDQAKKVATAMKHDAQDALKDKAGHVRQQAEDRVNQTMSRAAGGLENAAHKLDQAADSQTQGATGARAKAGRVAHGTADTMESVARYLRDNDARQLQGDLENQVRENPVQTLLIGVAAGWLVGKILR